MSRQLVRLAATLIGLLAVSGSASAQYYTPPYYPTQPSYGTGAYNQTALSPYLNLLRGGNPAANYFLGTVPEFQRRNNYNQLRTAIQEADIRTNTPLSETTDLGKPLEASGHPALFGYYSSFYPLPYQPRSAGNQTASPGRQR